ncbi:hypothetical protein FA13DRAFT_73493 [Coprinellus micaceus]|uniref:CENP-V/GFA domain-containing protein n=1 Tax=Coprinellus micaceus TaxID=71717 RepID=A0A4Y7TJN8_COPMI|nr:hypothetical protein FA13DRAFT_73493 [Coprinellus micaceus]
MPTTIHGQCLCQETQISVSHVEDYLDHRACHCTDCKQACGGAFSTSVMVPKRHVHIAGPTKEYTYTSRVPNGRIVTRVFCGTCGSSIAFRSPIFRDMEAVFTGTLPYFSNVPIKLEIWTKDRWNCISKFPNASQHKVVEGYTLPRFPGAVEGLRSDPGFPPSKRANPHERRIPVASDCTIPIG